MVSGDNESVSKIPILTLPSENFGKSQQQNTGNAAASQQQQQQQQQHLKSPSTSSHQRSASSVSTTAGTGHFMIPNQQQQPPPTPNHSSKLNPATSHLPDMSEDLRQFNSQYLSRSNAPGKMSSSQNSNPKPTYEDKQYPPCDFEKMKRLDSASGNPAAPGHNSSAGSQNSPNIPPVLPPRGLEMSRSSHHHHHHNPSGQFTLQCSRGHMLKYTQVYE